MISIAAGLILTTFFIFSNTSASGLVKVNNIEPNATFISSPVIPVSHTFSFKKSNVTISTAVNSSVYWGAKNTDKRVFTPPGVPFATWEGESVRSMIEDPAQNDLFIDLLGRFHEIRKEQNLTDDEYVDLLVAYAQSIDYHATDNPAKYPVETVYEAEGDCDDKSLLLAGLLSREGYRVALLLFEKDHHMVVGIGSDDNLYQNTGYSFVEIMDYSFVGIPVNKLRGAKKMYSDAIVIPIGNGTKIYHSGGETRYIGDMAALTDQRSVNQSFQMMNIEKDSAENISEYSRLSEKFYADSRIYTYIIRHRFDRTGVYAYLKNSMPAEVGSD